MKTELFIFLSKQKEKYNLLGQNYKMFMFLIESTIHKLRLTLKMT